MNGNIITKTSEKFGKVRIIEKDGIVLYCASDVAKALGYANTKDAILRHCKGVVKYDTPTNGGVQGVNYIPEADVYRLITHSKLPSAVEFEKWVFEEVVPEAVHKQLGKEAPDTTPKCEQVTLDTYTYNYIDKTFFGEPVITFADLAYFTNVKRATLYYQLSKYLKKDTEYFVIKGSELSRFKSQNPAFEISSQVKSLMIIKKSAVETLLKILKINRVLPIMTAESETPTESQNCQLSTVSSGQSSPGDCLIALNVLRNVKRQYENIIKDHELYKHSPAILETAQKRVNALEMAIDRVAYYIKDFYLKS